MLSTGRQGDPLRVGLLLEEAFFQLNLKDPFMNKLLAALIATAFATTGAFAADAKKDEMKK